MAKHTGRKKTAGGLSNEKFYVLFNNARCRVTDPTNPNYPRYGGRGIKFLWEDYVSFKEDMYESYLAHKKENGPDNTTLERIDNSRHYSKENCRWATWSEQAKNRRTNKYITYKGRTMIIADWAKELGVSRQSVRWRLIRGWDQDLIIETPFNYANRYTEITSASKKNSGTKSK